jgi:U3 small nucleolar ribonucleoprotein component
VQHVIIGLDNTQVFADLDLVSASATEFAQEDDNGDEDDDGSDDDEESDFDEDFNDVVRMNPQLSRHQRGCWFQLSRLQRG